MSVAQVQIPSLQLSDITTLLALAKTASINANDAISIGQMIERVETALSFAKLPRAAAPTAPPPAVDPPQPGV
jgi:hypothetical protein